MNPTRGCCFPKLFAICQVAETVKTNPILEERKIQESDCSHFLIQVHKVMMLWWEWMDGQKHVSCKGTTLDTLRCQQSTLGGCGDQSGTLWDTISPWSLSRVTRLLSINLINCGDLLRIDRPGYWRVVLFLHWLFKLFQTQSKGNLCSTKVSSEKDKGGA